VRDLGLGPLEAILTTHDPFHRDSGRGGEMIKARVLTIPILCAVLGGSLLGAEARWEDNEYWYNLVESGDRSSFALILYSKRLQTLAEAAIVEAVRLDAQEAPQREAGLQQKKEEESRLLLERARSVNKPNFRP